MRAIDADALIKSIDGNPFTTDSVKSYIHASVAKMPTIEPERKKGKWIPQDHNKTTGYETTLVYYYPKCSECGHTISDFSMNFCPYCGADMRGDDHD